METQQRFVPINGSHFEPEVLAPGEVAVAPELYRASKTGANRDVLHAMSLRRRYPLCELKAGVALQVVAEIVVSDRLTDSLRVPLLSSKCIHFMSIVVGKVPLGNVCGRFFLSTESAKPRSRPLLSLKVSYSEIILDCF